MSNDRESTRRWREEADWTGQGGLFFDEEPTEDPYGDFDQGKATRPEPELTRVVDLGPYLNGTFIPPAPEVGGARSDGVMFLYPGKWHTLVGLTTCGKSWLALWHAAEEMNQGYSVAYAHFEESSPAETLKRLLAMGQTADSIKKHFVWLDCTTRWKAGELHNTLAPVIEERGNMRLCILDGINAACSQHGWPVDKTDAVSEYRTRFVAPLTRLGVTPLSLGHPPKATDRQNERHGFGSSAWLDEVDGVGYRMVASKTEPIRRGKAGTSSLYSVKDRPGEVERHGVVDEERDGGWFFLGLFSVTNTDGDVVDARLTSPTLNQDGRMQGSLDNLAAKIRAELVRVPDMAFTSQKTLGELLRARRVNFDDKDLAPALLLLVEEGVLEWPEVSRGKARPGRLVPWDDPSA